VSFGEEAYLALVVAALCLFAGVLAVVSFIERRWARAQGRD
jgi:hypothetical protein